MDELFRQLLVRIGEDPQRPGLIKTPQRCSEMWESFSEGYRDSVERIVEGALLPAEGEKTIVVRNLDFCSMCEHHLLPFYGSMQLCYRPDQLVLGFGTLHKIVQLFARRLQIQESLGDQICEAIVSVTGAQSASVSIEAVHLCLVARNPAATRSVIRTFHHRGLAGQDESARQEIERLLS